MLISILGTVDEKRDVSEGQVAEEEVHGGVEARVQPDEQDDEQAAQHCCEAHAQEQGKDYALLFWQDGEPRRIPHAALVLLLHSLIFC